MTAFISLHAAVRHETARQTAVADALRAASRRYQAAVELQQASDQFRQARAAGRDTGTDRWRLNCAQAVWDAITIADRQVRP